jgi:hypothetical protein
MSDKFVYVILSDNPGANDIGLTVFPVPANGQLNVVFAAPAPANMALLLINSAGQTSLTQQQTIPTGNFSTVVDTSQLAPGSYVLKLLLGQKAYLRKIIVQR